jgi:hypothetical protein
MTALVLDADPAPQGRWWVLTLGLEAMGEGGYLEALLVLDTSGDEHWVAATDSFGGYRRHAWLPDGRLAWVTEEKLWLADADGRGRLDLGAPEAALEVWPIEGSRLFVGGDQQLWRYDFEVSVWDPVLGLEVEGPRPPASSPSSRLTVAPDGPYGALIHNGQIWKVPAALGSSAEWLAEIQYPGRGGRISPLDPLADSPYWVIGEVVLGVELLCGGRSYLLDTRDGTVTAFGTLLAEAGLLGEKTSSGSAPGLLLRRHAGACTARMEFSPDRKWVQAPLEEGIYAAPSNDLTGGRILPGAFFEGWRLSPAGLYAREQPDLEGRIQYIPLPTGEPARPLAGTQGLLKVHTAETAAGPYFAGVAGEDFKVLKYSQALTLEGELRLPTGGTPVFLRIFPGDAFIRLVRANPAGNLFLVAIGPEGEALMLLEGS